MSQPQIDTAIRVLEFCGIWIVNGTFLMYNTILPGLVHDVMAVIIGLSTAAYTLARAYQVIQRIRRKDFRKRNDDDNDD
jgi:hypothetical protein